MTTSDDLARLGRAVRTMRLILGLTQDGLTSRGGPSDVTIRGLENGSGKRPNGDTLRKLDAGFGWPAGFASKILRGEADVVEDLDEEGRLSPSLLDYEAAPRWPEQTPEQLEQAYANWRARETPVEDLAHEIAVRDSMLARKEEELRSLEREFAVAQVRLADMARLVAELRNDVEAGRGRSSERRGEEVEGRNLNTAHIPLPPDAYGLAASRGPSKGKALKAEMDAAGEESQDPGTEEPA